MLAPAGGRTVSDGEAGEGGRGGSSERSHKMGKWRPGVGRDFGPASGDGTSPDCVQSVPAAGPLRCAWRGRLLGVLPEDPGRTSL